MPDRVFYQVARDFGERFLRCQHHERIALDVECQGDTLRRGEMNQRFGRAAHDSGCVQVSYAGPIGAFQPCEAQELAHNASHALGFLAQNSHVVGCRQSLETRLDDGGGCPELMRSVGREPALDLDGFDQALKAGVHGRYQRLHLAGRLLDGKGRVSVPRRDPRGLLRKLP